MTLVACDAVLLAAVGGLGLWTSSTSNAALKTVYEDRTVTTAQIATISDLLLFNRTLMSDTMSRPDLAVIEANMAAVQANGQKINEFWRAFMVAYLTEEEKWLAAMFEGARQTWPDRGLGPAIAAVKPGDAQRVR